MTLWSAIALASVICLALKVTGYLVPPRLLEAPRPARIADLLTVALLAALVAVQTLGLLLLRAPFLVVVVAAAAVAAALRWWGLAV